MSESLIRKFAAATSMNGARIIRKLPKSIRDRFKEAIERSKIPDSIDFATIAKISSNVITNPFFQMSTDFENRDLREWWHNRMVEQFGHIEKAFGAISKSSKPLEYAKFLSRENFSITPFLAGIDLFVDRRVVFDEIPEETRKAAQELAELYKKGEITDRLVEIIENRLLEDEREDIEGGAPKLPEEDVAPVMRYLTKKIIALFMGDEKAQEVEDVEQEVGDIAKDAYRVVASYDWARYILAKSTLLKLGIYLCDTNDEGGEQRIFLLPFEKRFEKENLYGFYVKDEEFWKFMNARGLQRQGEILLAVYEEDTVQHEVQHMFDRVLCLGVKRVKEEPAWEYRARLAELLFAPDPEGSMKKMLEDSEGLEEGMNVSLDYHATGIALFSLKNNLFRDYDMDRIIVEAKEELDQQYHDLVGLTYDEILEPFKK